MDNLLPAKILIIDDESLNRALLEVFANADGYVTIAADGGEAGLALMIPEQPDLVLLDLMMPGMDGFEVMHRLKANPDTRSIPVIIVSALEDPASLRRARTAGADAFIIKPVDREELSLHMTALLQAQTSAGKPRQGERNE